MEIVYQQPCENKWQLKSLNLGHENTKFDLQIDFLAPENSFQNVFRINNISNDVITLVFV